MPSTWEARCERVTADEALVTCVGELDLDTAPRLVALVESAVHDGVRTACVDLRGVGFSDSTGIASLIALRRRCHREGAELHLVVGGAVERLLDTMALRRVFSLHADPAEVLPSLRPPGAPPTP